MSSPSNPSKDVETAGPAAGGESVVTVAGSTRVRPSQDVRVLPRGEELAESGLAAAENLVRSRLPLRSVPMNVNGTTDVFSGRALLAWFGALAAPRMGTPTPALG